MDRQQKLNTRKTPFYRLIAASFLGAMLGFVLVTFQEMLHGEPADSLLILVNQSVKNMSASYLLLLFAGGFFWGFVLKRPYSFCAATSQVVVLPIVSVIDIIKDSTSHNLWPFEFMLYAALTLISLSGLVAAWLLKRAFKKTSSIVAL